MFLFTETDGVSVHRRISFGDSSPFLSFFCSHITLDLVVSRHRRSLIHNQRQFQTGFPTSEGKPSPLQGQGVFEMLKKF